MTATHVNGIPVVADEPTLTPYLPRAGKPTYWQQVRTLTLANDTVVYGCTHCDYVSENVRSIRPHLKKHAPKKVRHVLPLAHTPHPLVAAVMEERKRRGISMKRLCRMTGLPRMTIRGWELGRHDPSVSSLTKYAAAVGLDLVLMRSQRQPVMDGQVALFEKRAS